MASKGSVELSINFLVIIILSMALLGFGLSYLYQILRGTEKLSGMTLEDIDKQIADLKCDNTLRICLEKSIVELEPKDFQIVTIRVLNIDQGDIFRIHVIPGIYVAPDNSVFYPNNPGYFNPISVLPNLTDATIKTNEAETFGIGFGYDKAPKGTYVFNIYINKVRGAIEEPYDVTQKLYINIR